MWNSSLKLKISTCHRKLWPAELVREAVLSWKRQKVNWKFHSDETSSKKIPLRWKPRPKKIPLWWKTRPKTSTPMETCSKIPIRWKTRPKKFHSDGNLFKKFQFVGKLVQKNSTPMKTSFKKIPFRWKTRPKLSKHRVHKDWYENPDSPAKRISFLLQHILKHFLFFTVACFWTEVRKKLKLWMGGRSLEKGWLSRVVEGVVGCCWHLGSVWFRLVLGRVWFGLVFGLEAGANWLEVAEGMERWCWQFGWQPTWLHLLPLHHTRNKFGYIGDTKCWEIRLFSLIKTQFWTSFKSCPFPYI